MRLKKSSLLIVFFLLIASFLVIRFTFNQLNYLKFDNNSLKSRFFFKNPNLPRIIVVIGTRPEAVKCAPLIAELKKEQYKTSFEVIVLSTGQHREILKQTLNSFNQKVDIDLDLMTTNQDLSQFFTSAYQKLTLEFKSLSPISLVVVQGDTTTALAAALAASYLHIQVAHVEAGLRSYDMENPFPEETNRRLIDAVSRLMLAPTEYSKQALINEGICPSDIFVTGNTGIDAFYSLQSKNLTEMPQILKEIQNFNPKKSSNKFVILVTMHRRENFQYMKDMCLAIKQIAEKYLKNVLIIFPVHPNPNVRQIVNGYLKNLVNVQIIEPISYDIFPHVLKESDIILTDSGGIQEESSSIGKSVILMRETTERPEGIYLGTIQQIGVKLENIVAAVEKALNSDKNQITKKDIFGDGLASERTAKIFQEYIEGKLKKDINCLTKSKQDALANQVFHQNKTSKFDNYIEPYETRKSRMLNRTKAKDRLTMSQIFALPSKYSITKKDDDEFGITAVLSLYKRTGLAKRWIESLLGQTHPPKIIWIVYFASPIESKIDAEINEIKTWLNQTGQSVILNVNKGEMQLKYFGRFQIALQSKTKYIVIFDDDCIPQKRFFEACLHTINTVEYRGILGTKGTPWAENYFYGPVSGSNTITEIDVVGGSWFMEREWVKLMFRDKMLTWETGEDFQICANARKYGNIRSFVMPVDKIDPSTNGFTADYIGISYGGDTNGHVQDHRLNLKLAQSERSDRYMDSYLRKEKTVMIFVEDRITAKELLKLYKEISKLSIDIALAVHNKTDVSLNLNELKEIINFKFFNDFMIGKEYNSNISEIAQAAETMYHFDIALQQTQSTALIVMGSRASQISLAVVTASKILNLPVVNFYSQKTSNHYSDMIQKLAFYNVLLDQNNVVKQNEIDKFNEIMQDLF